MTGTPPPFTLIDYGRRRFVLTILVTATVVGCLALAAAVLSGDGLDAWDAGFLLCLAVTLPWTAIGFWNAVIGLALMRMRGDRAIERLGAAGEGQGPISLRTGILSCIRNEDAAAVARNLDQMIAALAALGQAERFEIWLLSDSDRPACIEREEQCVERLRRCWAGRVTLGYRRRPENTEYKAGNIRDFLLGEGAGLDLALVLDADSLMGPETILSLARAMERNPQLGILQTLPVGLPSDSTFARVFQFGMRLGMRSYTLGSAWWQGDCGPYWGHNALIRVAPLREHCELPRLPGRPPLGGWVLSHDQVEAALMRRAGFEVRVLPIETDSWEQNPATLIDFIRRDLRWCQGNLQYFRLLGLPGLRLVSRVQLALAILMFLGSPAWVMLMLLGVLRVGLAPDPSALVDAELGLVLFAAVMGMVLAPKLATVAAVLLDPPRRQALGGAPRAVLSAVTELIFSMLLAPIMAIAHTRFMIGLAFGRGLTWEPQQRATHGLEVGEAMIRLWPQTLVGLAGFAWMIASGTPVFWLGPFYLGALLAVPLALATADPVPGRLLTRLGLWRIPEETRPPALLTSLALPALTLLEKPPGPTPVAAAISEPAGTSQSW